nr:potassium-transporting ATPase subunit F [Frondihabitans sp. VKM Ac-2883]
MSLGRPAGARGGYLLTCCAPRGIGPRSGSRPFVSGWSCSARHRLHSRRDCRLRGRRPRCEGCGEAVIVFNVIAAVLAVAALVYLVYALVKPERF